MVTINKRNIVKCIILSLVTFGIYAIYWEHLLVKNVRAIKKDNSSCVGEMLCLIFVPFYSLYWWFTRGKTVHEEFSKHGYSASGSEIVFLILSLFRFEIVAMAIMQNDFNSLPAESTNPDQQTATVLFSDTLNTAVNETASVNTGNANAASLLERAFLFLEDGKWQEADIYCERVLDIDPKNADAYLGKLMAELQVKNRKQLADLDAPFDDRDNYSKVLRFADEKLKSEMLGYINDINERNDNFIFTGIYENALSMMQDAQSEGAYKNAAEIFKSIPGFKDADTLAEECLDKAEVCRKDALYESGKAKMAGTVIEYYEKAIDIFQSIPGWKDADEQIYACQKKIEELHIAAEKAKKKAKKIAAIVTPIIAACVAFIIVLTTVIIPTAKYNNAVEKYGKEWADIVKNASVGNTITFGTYEQDNNTSNGKEAIEWTVLDKDGMSLFLISKYALDCEQYNTVYTDVTWEKCSLRKWLNGTFLNNAFSTDEQAKIATTNVSADKNPIYNTNPGNSTNDKVFLLSIKEAEKYFTPGDSRKCAPTAYATAKGAYTSDSYKTASGEATCWWWFRSPGNYRDRAAYVRYDGLFDFNGDRVYTTHDAVRPALWINLE